MHTSACVSITTQMSTVFSLICLGPIILENDPPFFAPWVTLAYQSWKNLKPCTRKDWEESAFVSVLLTYF